MDVLALVYWMIVATIALVCVAGASIEIGMAIFRRLERYQRVQEPALDLQSRRASRALAPSHVAGST